jgi:hypothetical protein
LQNRLVKYFKLIPFVLIEIMLRGSIVLMSVYLINQFLGRRIRGL